MNKFKKGQQVRNRQGETGTVVRQDGCLVVVQYGTTFNEHHANNLFAA